MEPVRLVDDNGNLVSSTTVVKASRLPSLSAIQQAAIDADNARSPYGQALPGMAVTPDTQVRKKITLEDVKNAAIDNPAKTALAVGGLKYPFNYGLWNTSDIRPLASVPLAVGLGALGYKASKEDVK